MAEHTEPHLTVNVTQEALTRIHERRQNSGQPDLYLQILVDGGGCAGFQYKLAWTQGLPAGALCYADAVITDDISIPYLAGATVDFTRTMMGEDFKINNPNAVMGCGCGTSFSMA
jgi:iron-sulfur cluster insertion protein